MPRSPEGHRDGTRRISISILALLAAGVPLVIPAAAAAPAVVPAQAGTHGASTQPSWIPASAGMTAAEWLPPSVGMTAGAAGTPPSPDTVLIPHTSYLIPSPDPDGRALYVAQCAACHMPGGTGIAGAFPPLAGSQWVTGDERMIVRIVLHGITGEVEVGREIYDGLMPPLGGVLSDAEIAAVATYVRGSWGNDAAAVSTATVARERTATAGRDGPWTAAQLLAGLEIVK